MKKKLIVFGSLLAFLLLTVSTNAQSFTKNVKEKTMTWTSSSEKAKQLCSEGVDLFFNIEFAQAYDKMKEALDHDPNFTIPLVFLTNLTRGELQKKYRTKTANSLTGKTEGEKLFASTAQEENTPEKDREVFKNLYNMFPDGSMVGGFYVFTRATPDEQFKACQEYNKKFPKQAWVYNIMAYYYMNQKKDMAKAKEYFQKYIDANPDGCNPYDSMGEFYYNNGDMENSRKYYRMALDKYPFNNSSINKLADIGTVPSQMHGFVPNYSANFVMAPSANSEAVLALWKDWKDGDLSKSNMHFADSITLYLADGTQMSGPTGDVLKGMQDYRSSFTKMEVNVDAVFAVRSVDKNEDWVTIWGTEKQTKDGKTEDVSLQETWRFNKDGKIDMMFQAARKGILPPPPSK